MTPGERQYDIAIIIAAERGRDAMTVRERCDDTNTEIIVAKEGQSEWDEGMREQDRGRGRGREEVMAEGWGTG